MKVLLHSRAVQKALTSGSCKKPLPAVACRGARPAGHQPRAAPPSGRWGRARARRSGRECRLAAARLPRRASLRRWRRRQRLQTRWRAWRRRQGGRQRRTLRAERPAQPDLRGREDAPVAQKVEHNAQQYTIHNTQYTIHNTQYTIHNTQYTIHNTQYTTGVDLSFFLSGPRGGLRLLRARVRS
jgi:hypothetical protein